MKSDSALDRHISSMQKDWNDMTSEILSLQDRLNKLKPRREELYEAMSALRKIKGKNK